MSYAGAKILLEKDRLSVLSPGGAYDDRGGCFGHRGISTHNASRQTRRLADHGERNGQYVVMVGQLMH